jgi:hypothetical protein
MPVSKKRPVADKVRCKVRGFGRDEEGLKELCSKGSKTGGNLDKPTCNNDPHHVAKCIKKIIK